MGYTWYIVIRTRCSYAFSRTGGTAGRLLNLRPGTRGMVTYDGPAGQRAGRPGLRLSASRPLERSLLYVANHLTSYTAVRLPASTPRWSTYPAVHEANRASTMALSLVVIMDNPGGTSLTRGPYPASLEPRIVQHPSQPTRKRNPRLGRYRTYDPAYPLSTGHVACRG